MQYAMIKDGMVVNVAVWDGARDWLIDDDITVLNIDDISPQPGIGWSFDGAAFNAPPVPEKTKDEIEAEAEHQKQALIDQANDHINSRQWPGKAVMGRLSDTEKEQYNTWLDYLDALYAVDTSAAPDIDWPVAPAE